VRANGTNNGISADSATSVEVKSGEGEESESSEMDLESSGFIVDGTQTKLGRDFYESFFSFWVQPENTGEFTIVITERPLPQRGTQVSMTVNDFLIFQAFLEPRHEAIEEMASSAVYRALGFIQNYQEALRELEGDDMEGTGLF
jgi:curli production assembly/transport component CsgE